MFYAPYKLENFFSGVQSPSAVIKNNSAAYWFWVRALYQRLCSTIEFNLPNDWNRARDYFEACLFCFGYLAVFEDDKFGTVFQNCTLSGYDFYYQPSKAIVTNPLLPRSLELEIGKDTELIRLTNDYAGVLEIVRYYAEKLATLDGAINMNIINSKFGYMLVGKSKPASEAIKMAFDKMNRGEPLVVVDKSVFSGLGEDSPFEFIDRSNIGTSYFTDKLLQDAKTLLDSFDTEIGIKVNSAPDKKERLITQELEANQADASSRVSLWDECLGNSIKAVNKRFGLNISYKFRFLDGNDGTTEENEESEAIKRWVLQSQR